MNLVIGRPNARAAVRIVREKKIILEQLEQPPRF